MKNFVRKLLATLAAAALLLSSVSALAYTPGTYNAAAQGLGGMVNVEVTFTDDAIESIAIGENSETPGIGTQAFDQLPSQIIEHQSLNIEAVTGATITSKAVLEAVAACVEQANGDVEALKNKAVEVVTSNEIVDMDTDILVVGGGGCGLAAALEAANAGAKVILVEKLGNVGGSTALSGGAIIKNSAGEEGFDGEFTLSDLAAFWKEMASHKGNEALTDKIASMAQETYEWLNGLGIPYTRMTSTVPGHPELAIYNAGTDAVSTGGGGQKVTKPLYDAAVTAGVQFYLSTRATELITDENGLVTGAIAIAKDGTTLNIHSKKVILATGSFDQGDNEVKQIYFPVLLGVESNSSAGNSGDGIMMAVNATDAATQFASPACKGFVISDTGHGLVNMSSLPPKNSLIVSREGERFVNEGAFYANVLYGFINSGNNYGYQILDANTVLSSAVMEESLAEGRAYKADTLEELAGMINVPVDTFMATVARYNELAGKEDVDFGKETEYMQGVFEAPFYALGAVPTLNGTIGGLLINENAQVLDTNGQPIENLYAGGDVASTSMFYNLYPASGSGVQFAVSSGRLAARSAVATLAD